MSDSKLIYADCLKAMQKIPSHSIDMILADLPYGTTNAKWDAVIPMKLLWKQYQRIIKKHGCIALFGVGLFTAKLETIGNKFVPYRYNWIWKKTKGTGALNCHHMPMKAYEDISIFYKRLPTYHPQMRVGSLHNKHHAVKHLNKGAFNHGDLKHLKPEYTNLRYPLNVITFPNVTYGGREKFHPTQKPVKLLEYLIKTYTNPNDLVLDNTMGSGSTGVACKLLNRRFMGIELNQHYYHVAVKRIMHTKTNHYQPISLKIFSVKGNSAKESN